MTVDPSDPETFTEFEDSDETRTALRERAAGPGEPGLETPEADSAEQRTELAPRQDDAPHPGAGYSANEADRAEQSRVVELDEDDYR